MVERNGDRHILPLRLSRRFQGYSWVRISIGSRELARAIIRDATGDESIADDLCARFVREVVSRWSAEGFELSAAAVRDWIRDST
jgi:hypothetical protein